MRVQTCFGLEHSSHSEHLLTPSQTGTLFRTLDASAYSTAPHLLSVPHERTEPAQRVGDSSTRRSGLG